MKAPLNDFAFRGLSASYCIRDLQSSGLLRTPAITPDERNEQDLFAPVSDTIRNGSTLMARYYRQLYVFENLVREFVSIRFAEVDGENWFDKRASAGMKAKVDDRKRKELKNNWHVGRNPHPLFHLDFGDLGLLIINHWDVFKDFFDNQAWVSSRIQEAERTRNVIAHTNLLAADEGARLEMYLRDWLRQIG